MSWRLLASPVGLTLDAVRVGETYRDGRRKGVPSAAAKRINAASDDLTKTLEAIQQKLNELALGVDVWLDHSSQELERTVVSEADTPRIHATQELGYGRHGDGWALLVREMNYEQEREKGPGGNPPETSSK